ncbi:hypothetical protein [Antrihabitans stalagmiti]|nr:hypothetical protein [Antrihabitans stalagmiti]
MTSSWPRRLFGRARTREPDRGAQEALTTAFLDMDKRQSIAEAAVQASDQLFPERRMGRLWQPIADRCYQASAGYLAVSEQFASTATTSAPPVSAPQNSYERTMQELTYAARSVDEFYQTHRQQLEDAVARLAAVPAVVTQSLAAAETARSGLRGDGERYIGYPSVQQRTRDLDSAVAALDAAQAGGAPAVLRDAASRVRAAASALEAALAAAPNKEREATQAISSVTTRISGVRTRAERLAPAYSTLLRDFNAASSKDLAGNEASAKAEIESAAAALLKAHMTLNRGDPESALDLTAAIRAHLANAERHIDAVTDRLALLREVRDNPKQKEDEVRFRLRDAQMLAVNRGIVSEWASVLDAQLERIDRISGALNGRHPDYWAYVTGLDAVKTFISGVVQRMKKQEPGT